MDWTKLIADLREARRYVRSDAMEARRRARAVMEQMQAATKETYEQGLVIARLIQNLAVGSFFAVVSPDVFAGYLAGAAFELEARTWAIAAIAGEVEHAAT